MSTKALYWALEQAELKPAPWRVLVLLCDAANSESGAAWLSIPSLVRRSGLSRSTVIRAIQDLHAAGYLVPGDKRYVSHIPKDKRPNVWMVNQYRNTPGDLRGLTLPLEGSHDDTPCQDDTSRGVKHALDGVSESDPNQELEPTTGTFPAQRHPYAREATDLGASLPGAVPPTEALDHIARCRAAITNRKESQQ